MFKKKRVPVKPGFKMLTIKNDKFLFDKIYIIWKDHVYVNDVDEIELIGGPTVLAKNGGWTSGFNELDEYVSKRSEVRVWVPEGYFPPKLFL